MTENIQVKLSTQFCQLLRILVLVAGSYAFVTFAALSSAVASPNVLIYLADDMGWGDSRVYNNRAQFAMPNLEQLASDGMRFNDAHTSGAKCAPARYSLLSGNYQYRGLQPWGQWNFRGGSQFLPGQQTLGDVFKSAGYATAYIGKMHLGGEFYEKNSNNFVNYQVPEENIDFSRGMFDGPLTYGFDYDYVVLRGIQRSPYAFFENDKLAGNVGDLFTWQPGQGLGPSGLGEIISSGIGLPDWDSSNVGPRLATKAIDFIDRHHRQNLSNSTDIPFFMFYSPEAAHGPFTPPNNLLGEPVRGATGLTAHTDMLYENDVALGKLLEALRSRGLEDNTLVIFTSDNGGLTRNDDKSRGHFSVANLAGRKGEILEGGHRVPFIVKWGDGTNAGSVVAPGSVSNQMIGIHDLMATLADMLDISLPADQARDSFNILPVLLGEQSESTPVRDHLMVEADTVNGIGGQPRHWAYREGPWKLILDANNNPDRLFNLANDISERTNLINNPGEATRVQNMRASFFQRRQAARTAPGTGDPIVELSVSDVRVNESAGTLNVIVTASRAPSRAVSVTAYSRVDGNAIGGQDFYSKTGVVTISAGSTQGSMPITILNDSISEGDETFSVRLVRAQGASINNGAATVTIVDDDSGNGTPTLSISDKTVSEGDGTVDIDVVLSQAATTDVSVLAFSRDGQARGGSDFWGFSETVTIPRGQTRATATLTILDDSISEATETLTVHLIRSEGASIADDVATVTIQDDDNQTNVEFRVGNVVVNEGDVRAQLQVSLNRAANAQVQIFTRARTAQGGSDYYGFTRTLNFAAGGATTQTVNITIVENSERESDETLEIHLVNAIGGEIATPVATVTIKDND